MKSNSEHWNRIFRETADEKLGWYENDPVNTLRLLDRIPDWKNATVFLPGAGTSVLVEHLLEAGARLVLNDISMEALDRLRARLGERASQVGWSCQDVARPLGGDSPPIDIWVDRAVLHFLCEESDIEGYFKNVRDKLAVGGHALFAEFSMQGATRCAGLGVHRYSHGELTARLGDGFVMVDHLECAYRNPVGEPRPYIYTLFKHVA